MPAASMQQQQQQNSNASRQMEGDAIIIISSGAGFGSGGGAPPAFPASRSGPPSAPVRDWGREGVAGGRRGYFADCRQRRGLRSAPAGWASCWGEDRTGCDELERAGLAGIGLAAAGGLAVRHCDAYSLGYYRRAMDG